MKKRKSSHVCYTKPTSYQSTENINSQIIFCTVSHVGLCCDCHKIKYEVFRGNMLYLEYVPYVKLQLT